MIVALVVLRHPRWYPLLDLAWTEMRLRDVWSAHPPLLGLAGRIGPFGHQGSHPGPLSFYALWPFYQLFGASAWAMEAASVALHVVAIGVMLWIANRRAGLRLALGSRPSSPCCCAAFGAVLLTQAWNPYLPVLWWLVFLLAVWSVLCDDLALLPVAAFAGSFCAQTEVAYLGLCVGLGVIGLAVAGVRTYRRRGDRDQVRRFVLWTLIAAAVAVAVWLPPVVEQLTTARGNLSVLFDYFRNPPQSPAGLGQGIKVLLAHLNPVTPFTKALVPTTSHVDVTTGSVIPGSMFLAVWAVAAITAWRRRLRPLLELHIVIAADDPARRVLDQPHLRHPLVLPGAVGLGPQRRHARRGRLDARRRRRPPVAAQRPPAGRHGEPRRARRRRRRDDGHLRGGGRGDRVPDAATVEDVGRGGRPDRAGPRSDPRSARWSSGARTS